MHQSPLFPEWSPGAAEDADRLAELRAFDELGVVARRYRASAAFGRLLDFVIRMRGLSPYNAALLHLQKPGAREVRTAAEWRALGRRVREGVQPALLLHPGGPLRFVFDVAETEGAPVAVPEPEAASPAERLRASVEQARRLGVEVVGPLFGPEPRGRLRRGDGGAAFVLSLEAGTPEAQYATLVYELARFLLGHLGPCDACGAEARPPADDISGRFEAGAVAAIVCGRAGVPTEAGAFVRGYLQNFAEVPEVSLDRVLAVAGRIERLGRTSRG
ncbi:hypothetical protein [Oceanithermus sp.]